jgi:hypothetical protein
MCSCNVDVLLCFGSLASAGMFRVWSLESSGIGCIVRSWKGEIHMSSN